LNLINLSKSKLLSFRQCSLKLWNEVYHRDLAGEIDSGTQFRFDEGTRVGELARLRYPGGLLIVAEYWEVKEALKQTREALEQSSRSIQSDPSVIPAKVGIQDMQSDSESTFLDSRLRGNDNLSKISNRSLTHSSGAALFEAAFEARRTRVRCDIMIRRNATDWEMWEVKGVGTPKEIHLFDLAVQKRVTELWAKENNYPLNIVRCGILHLNKEYVYEGGEYDVEALFSEYDCNGLIDQYIPEVEQAITDGFAVVNASEPPSIQPGSQCSSPYRCQFSGTACELPVKEELKQLYRISAKKLETLKSRGINRIEDLSEDDHELSEIQSRIVGAIKSGKTQIETTLKNKLQEIGYPRYHLDFETISPVLPRYKGTRPFQTLPFQFSVHTEFSSSASAAHDGYLHEEDTDPRPPLAEALLQYLEAPDTDPARANAPILCYSPYEKRMLNELGKNLPDLAPRLNALKERLVDLLPVIRNNVYDKDFGGGFSIKKVLPALVPHLGYDDLDIADGESASLKYLEMLEYFRLAKENPGDFKSNSKKEEDQVDPLERAKKIRTDLWLYCHRDTEAMVYLLKALNKLVNSGD